jgi:plastocyanin
VTKIPALALTAGALALGLTACGGSSSSTTASSSTPATSTPAATSTAAPTSTAASTSSSAPAPSGGLELAADPSGQLKFTKTSLSAKAGKVTIAFTNSASLAHNLTIASASGTVVGATPTFQGGSKTLSLNLKPGTYTFYCSVPGHRQAGMQGTLVVK